MQYALLIYKRPGAYEALSDEERRGDLGRVLGDRG